MLFEDRVDAGKRLAAELERYRGKDVLVLGIPRGGVVVAYQVASALDADLDVIIPRKIGAPGQPELAIGAIASHNDVVFLDPQTISYLGVSDSYIREEIARQKEEIARRERMYRGDRPFPKIEGRTVILVDDGIATGATTIAAARSIKHHNPSRLVLAVPVAPYEAIYRLRPEVDDLVVLETPEPFFAVGSWYNRFDQTTDEEVIELLTKRQTDADSSR